MTPYPTKITFGEMRASGVRDVLICCRDHRCSNNVATYITALPQAEHDAAASDRDVPAPFVRKSANWKPCPKIQSRQ